MRPDEPDFEISESTITGHHPRVDIFTNERRRRIHRWRLVLVSAMIVVLVAFGLLSQRTTIAAYISARQPTPAPTALPLRLVLNSNVTYGTLTVNGKVVPLGIDNPYLPLIINTDKTTITLAAPPFRPLTCVINRAALSQHGAPGSASRLCKLSDQGNGARTIDMNFTLDDLVPQARQQFDEYLQAKIDQFSTLQGLVPAGQHYAIAPVAQFKQSIAVAHSTLHAHPLIVPVSDTSFASSECSVGVCPGILVIDPNGLQSQSIGYVAFHFRAQIGWQFADSTGHTFATFLPSNPNVDATLGKVSFLSYFEIHIAYDAATGWYDVNDGSKQSPLTDPTLQLTNELCNLGTTSAITLREASTGTSNSAFATVLNAKATLSGCVFWMGTNSNGPAGSGYGGPDLVNDTYNPWFLVHFGAVMAINPLAHALMPELPVASLAEVADVEG